MAKAAKVKSKAPRAKSAPRKAAPKSKAPTMSRDARSAQKIRVTAKDNPRREGTDGHKYFADLKGAKTVGDYLGKYKDQKKRRDAALWLRTNVNQGHVQLS